MLRDTVGPTLAAALLALVAAASGCSAAPVACPNDIGQFSPKNGDIFIASAANPLRRIRDLAGGVAPSISLKPDDHISFYYFAAPDTLSAPMVFALIRAYKIRADHSTSLDPGDVWVSNSLSEHKKVPATDYNYFHNDKRLGPNILRTKFHMKFYDVFYKLDNSYDDLDDPGVYALPKGTEFNGYKARMQRIKGFPQGGRCVVFELFRRKTFAAALDFFSLSLVALADDRDHPNDRVSFTVKFAASP